MRDHYPSLTHTDFMKTLPVFVNRVEENFDMQMHKHDFAEITYVSEGRGFHYINEQRIEVVKGDVFIMPVGTRHVFRPASTRPGGGVTVFNCGFEPDWLLSMHRQHPYLPTDFLRWAAGVHDGEEWRRTRDQTGRVAQWFREMNHAYTFARSGNPAIVIGLCLALLGELNRLLEQTGEAETSPSETIERAIYWIHHRYDETLQAKALASQLGISEGHFHRLFRRETGVSFLRYTQDVRMEAACRRLRETSDKISAVAASVGYRDVKHFHALFVRGTGCTPHEYRRRTEVKAR